MGTAIFQKLKQTKRRIGDEKRGEEEEQRTRSQDLFPSEISSLDNRRIDLKGDPRVVLLATARQLATPGFASRRSPAGESKNQKRGGERVAR